MKEEIYTIPVNDGFKEDTECAFCAMYRKLEADTLDFVLSPSYMEEDVRGETNELGFCRCHMDALYRQSNSLGVALILQSHLEHQRGKVRDLLQTASGGKTARRFGGKKEGGDPIAEYLKEKPASCYICRRIDAILDRYFGAFFILWKRDPEFRKTVLASKGFCLPHFLKLHQAASGPLSGNDLAEFRRTIADLEERNLDRVAGDLKWFTMKFDYRYQKEPWKNSKDAVPRAIQKVNGQFVSK